MPKKCKNSKLCQGPTKIKCKSGQKKLSSKDYLLSGQKCYPALMLRQVTILDAGDPESLETNKIVFSLGSNYAKEDINVVIDAFFSGTLGDVLIKKRLTTNHKGRFTIKLPLKVSESFSTELNMAVYVRRTGCRLGISNEFVLFD